MMFEGLKGMLALPEDPDKNAAARQGLLALGGAMLGGRGNFGEVLGQGLMAGTQGYQAGLAQQQQAAIRRAQQQRWDLENRETEAKLAEPGELQKILSGGAVTPMGPPAGLPRIGGAPTAGVPSAHAAPAAQPDLVQTYLEYGNRLTQAGRPQQAKAYYDLAEKMRPKLKEQRALTVDGRRVMANVYEDGRTEQVEGFQPDADKLHFANTGGSTVALDPFTGKPVNTIRNTQSPDSAASVAATIRGQNLSDTRARELNEITKQGQRSQIINDPTQGPIVVDKGTGQARQVTMNGQPVQGEATTKREASAKNLIPLIKKASTLIDGSTGSYLGAGYDHAARLFGSATDGSQNIAQLRVLEGNIMMAQPRMEGPQSNLDTELYRQMAAQVADPTLPNSTKKAALRTLYSLYKKYDPDADSADNPFAEKNAAPEVKPLKDLPKKQAAGIPAGWSVKEK